jgi:hypothetical protein
VVDHKPPGNAIANKILYNLEACTFYLCRDSSFVDTLVALCSVVELVTGVDDIKSIAHVEEVHGT